MLPSSNDELLPLSCDQLPTRSWRRQTALTASDDHRIFLDLSVSAMAALFPVVMTPDNLVSMLFSSWGTPLLEPDLFALNIYFTGSRTGPVSAAEGDVFSLNFTD
jgi:nicotinamide mononucleotide adenylyltransferase